MFTENFELGSDAEHGVVFPSFCPPGAYILAGETEINQLILQITN